MKSKTWKKAREEFRVMERACKGKPEDQHPIVLQYKREILRLVDRLEKSGLSGGSAPFYASAVGNTVRDLVLHRCISPLTGSDDEWILTDWPVDPQHGELYQNRRMGAVFMDRRGAYYLDAIVWQGEDEHDRFTGTIEGFNSAQGIKSFPFTPKTFTIHVRREAVDYESATEEERENIHRCGDGDYRYWIADVNELAAVWEYYDRRD